MKVARLTLISGAIALMLSAGPARAVLERVGPVSRAPTIGGYPAWFQDKTGVAIEFCDPKSQSELDGGWCVLVPPGPVFPEAFPDNFFDEHFYYAADNTLVDAGAGFKARLVVALEAAFSNGPVVDTTQMTFGRIRLFMPRLPFDGDYRVITPYSDITYYDQKAGERIFETNDVGVACINTFECTLDTAIGPFLLPSPVAGGPEVPPMPDLQAAPPGTDPFYDLLVATGAPTPSPGTGKQYLADPARVGPITGSLLPNFTDSDGVVRNHNTFRIEVRAPAPNHDGPVIFVSDGETNFTVAGRLMTGTLPGKVARARATYKADSYGNVTDLDVFASASPTLQTRIPARPQQPPVTPLVSFYDQACAGAVSIDPNTGATVIGPGPYSAPAGVPHMMAAVGSDVWGQSQPGGQPPSHVCIEDGSARNAAGQVVPAYSLERVTDTVTISSASYAGASGATLTVNAVSSDPTAVLALAGYGPAPATTPGVSAGKGAGTGLELAANSAQVTGLLAPPSQVQVSSTKGGSALRTTDTAHGAAMIVGVPGAVNDSVTIDEDCSPTAATLCAAGQSVTIDLLANDTVVLNGYTKTLREVVSNNLGTVTVSAQAPRLGVASVSPDGILTYTPNANLSGTDSVQYSVTVNGQASNLAQAQITITPVNDYPVAGNVAAGAVVAKPNQLNLIATSTDPDGNADVRDAVITAWPAGLGVQPVPTAGTISFQPTSAGNFVVNYRVKDAAGLLSANTASGTVTVTGAETIAYTKNQFKIGNSGGSTSTRWTVTGTDTVRSGQQLTIVYLDGTLRTGASCNGTATNPSCVIGTAVVDAAGNFSYDVGGVPGGPSDPTDTKTWSTLPRNIRTYSSNPVLGGAQNIGIQLK
ncbi:MULTISPECIES: cadherin-like domain-containing protein [Ramlibacter]|uniref:Tandem-95 repeat protein n=1 Tax=Ramlibacter pinisoli TaxID=2682844 RepID=A0A6N8IXT4_9BURK|nr:MULTISPECIES: cadherin-like domain-containing protein [Ramlibacter]MBA2961852.1 hypothetical protein [Ramlibacter sp. CGMCC 1.13660]MVQ31794.1 hypothetical protein [Ramlibacter pinisoli]